MVKLVARELTHSVIGAFYETYRILGFGFLESVYAAALERELLGRGHEVSREHAVQVFYKNEPLVFQRVDFLVDRTLIVELKSTPVLPPTAVRQLLNYLRATNVEVGVLLHFGPEPRFHRLVSLNAKADSVLVRPVRLASVPPLEPRPRSNGEAPKP